MSEREIQIRPWYREPWPWIIIGSIGFVMLACFVTLGIAIWSYDGLVADDYYKKGLTINKTLAREERSVSLGLSASLRVLSGDTVQIVLQSGEATFEPPQTLRLHLVHPRFPDQDREVVLVRMKDNVYDGRFVSPEDGHWKVVLEGDDWRLPVFEVQAPITEARWGQAPES